MSKTISKLKKALRSPLGTIITIVGPEKMSFLSDEVFIKAVFKMRVGYRLNLDNPQTYNEKLQWIKLYDRDPRYTIMVDKVKVRDLISKTIGDQYLIPCIGVWNSEEEIDFESLPEQFVLKCNHNSGIGMCICKDKSELDIPKVKAELRKGLNQEYFYHSREWPYKNVPKRIIGEKYMVDESGEELKDYKVMCFNGEPKLIELHMGRFTDHQSQDFYDTEWNKTKMTQGGLSLYGGTEVVMPKPETLDEMLSLSRILSQGIPHVRVDWYSINDRLYFGELTFFDGSGFDPYDNPEDDLLLGSWIKLPDRKKQ